MRQDMQSDFLFPAEDFKIGDIEQWAERNSYFPLVGVDEAGRGPWAGPVVASAVIFPAGDLPSSLSLLNDSKQVRETVRQSLVEPIKEHALAVGIGSIPASRIDQINILQATFEAMSLAVNHALDVLSKELRSQVMLLIDGRQKIPNLLYPQRALIKGDARSWHIAAASIIAKVVRDQMMYQAHSDYPQYAFDRHKGYGTKVHQQALAQHGPCPIHRMSFKPLKRWQAPDLN
jgi:ribonuclease HII